MQGPSKPPGPAIFLSWRAADVAPRPGTRRPRRRTKTRNRTDPKTGRITSKILAKKLAGQAQTQIRDSLIHPAQPRINSVFFSSASELLRTFGSLYMSFQSALLMSLGSSNQALRACIEPAWMSKRQTGAAEVSNMFVHHILKQIATLHGRGKHGEAEQARCHGRGNYSTSYEPSTKVRLRVRVLLLFALAGIHFRHVGSMKTLFTYHLHCTRRCAALCVKPRRWGATERAPSRAENRVQRNIHNKI